MYGFRLGRTIHQLTSLRVYVRFVHLSAVTVIQVLISFSTFSGSDVDFSLHFYTSGSAKLPHAHCQKMDSGKGVECQENLFMIRSKPQSKLELINDAI